MAARKGGWPKRDYKPGERVGLSFRVTPEFKAKLDYAAEKNGRSISQEAERLMELGMIFETMLAFGQNRFCDVVAETESTIRDSAEPNGQATGTKGHENGLK